MQKTSSILQSRRACWLIAYGLPLLLLWLWLSLGYTHRYATTTQFVLRNQHDTASMSLGAASLLGAGGGEQQDLHMIREYILSPNLLEVLNRELDLRTHYSARSILPPQRLPADASFDVFLAKYQSLIDVSIDTTSSILTLTVEGYSPEQTLRQSQLTLKAAEDYVNEVSRKIAERQTSAAREHLDKTKAEHAAKSRHVLAFQQENNTFMPDKDGSAALSIIAGLESALATEKAHLASTLAYLAPTAPAASESQAKIRAIEEQIALERARLTRSASATDEGATPFNQLLASYQIVQLELDLATQSYAGSLTALQSAQIAASENLKSLVLVSSPMLPQDHSYPRIWVWMLAAGTLHLFTAAPIAGRLLRPAPGPKGKR
ncbi:MAG: sugar transporter [Rariglobus sp.]|nr:sugar transporter [Rariglobus sp.]